MRRGPALVALVALVSVAFATACGPDKPVAAPPTSSSAPVTAVPSPSCPPGQRPARITPPPERSTVRLRVLNGTGRAGLATAVAGVMRERGLTVVGTGSAPDYDGVVIVRYGPSAVGAAWDIEPYFGIGMPDATVVWRDDFQLDRAGDEVDLVLGKRFQQLASITEVNQATAHLTLPSAPPGTCAVPD